MALAGAVLGGCLGTSTGGRSQVVDLSAASGSAHRVPRPPASEWVWTDAKPTSWPLPYASHYANMPPAGTDGGPTKPCAPHVDWGKATPLPPGSGRQAGLGCSDMKPVRYPVCTEEQVARATRMDAAGEEPVDFNTLRPVALRGYLRRAELMPTGLGWNVRLEASSGHGRCSRITVAARPDGSEPPPPPARIGTGRPGWHCATAMRRSRAASARSSELTRRSSTKLVPRPARSAWSPAGPHKTTYQARVATTRPLLTSRPRRIYVFPELLPPTTQATNDDSKPKNCSAVPSSRLADLMRGGGRPAGVGAASHLDTTNLDHQRREATGQHLRCDQSARESRQAPHRKLHLGPNRPLLRRPPRRPVAAHRRALHIPSRRGPETVGDVPRSKWRTQLLHHLDRFRPQGRRQRPMDCDRPPAARSRPHSPLAPGRQHADRHDAAAYPGSPHLGQGHPRPANARKHPWLRLHRWHHPGRPQRQHPHRLRRHHEGLCARRLGHPQGLRVLFLRDEGGPCPRQAPQLRCARRLGRPDLRRPHRRPQSQRRCGTVGAAARRHQLRGRADCLGEVPNGLRSLRRHLQSQPHHHLWQQRRQRQRPARIGPRSPPHRVDQRHPHGSRWAQPPAAPGPHGVAEDPWHPVPPRRQGAPLPRRRLVRSRRRRAARLLQLGRERPPGPQKYRQYHPWRTADAARRATGPAVRHSSSGG